MSVNLSSKYIKQTALEGTFSPTQNLISFSIQDGMKVDLSECAVLVDLSILSSDVNATVSAAPGDQFSGGAGVYRQHLLLKDSSDDSTVYPNVAFIKNADIRCEKVGQIESLRRVDTLKIAQYIYLQDLESKIGGCYQNGISNDGVGGMNGTPFRDLVRMGSVKSRNRPAQLRIPLKDIFDVANTPVWDTAKYGRTDIKLEMNFDKMHVVTTMGRTDANWANAAFGVYGAIDPFLGGVVSTEAGSVNFFKTTKTYINPEEQGPFHVGQKLIFEYTSTATGADAVVYSFDAGNYRERTITQIQHNVDNDNKLTITFDVGIAYADATTFSLQTVQGSDPGATKTIVWNKVEMEMKQVNGPTPPTIEYTTYSTEEDSGFSATQTNINKQYTMEANADNLFICACTVDTGVQRIAPTVQIKSSRITIDNIEETSEPVIHQNIVADTIDQAAPLYYDRLDRFYMNLGDDLECLQESILGQNVALENNPGRAMTAYGQPLPIKAMPKQVQLDINYTAGEIKHLQLYKRLVKQI